MPLLGRMHSRSARHNTEPLQNQVMQNRLVFTVSKSLYAERLQKSLTTTIPIHHIAIETQRWSLTSQMVRQNYNNHSLYFLTIQRV